MFSSVESFSCHLWKIPCASPLPVYFWGAYCPDVSPKKQWALLKRVE